MIIREQIAAMSPPELKKFAEEQLERRNEMWEAASDFNKRAQEARRLGDDASMYEIMARREILRREDNENKN